MSDPNANSEVLSMEAYRVEHMARGVRYYVLAKTAAQAIEIVTLRLGDPEGSSAWKATPGEAPPNLRRGVVIDEQGKPIQSMEF